LERVAFWDPLFEIKHHEHHLLPINMSSHGWASLKETLCCEEEGEGGA